MLFHVAMTVNLPHELGESTTEALKARERERAAKLQRQGQWRHFWRMAGRYANLSIFDVEDAEELHALLTSLPLYPFMQIEVTALCHHPSAIRDVDT